MRMVGLSDSRERPAIYSNQTMKKLLMILIISASCTKKDQIDFIPDVKSVTYLHHMYEKNVRYKTDTVIHWCKVSGEELKRFEGAVKIESYCDRDDSLELKIDKSCLYGK